VVKAGNDDDELTMMMVLTVVRCRSKYPSRQTITNLEDDQYQEIAALA